MSFAPRTESPALTPSTPDRRNTWQEAQAVPFGLGYFRVAPKWISDRFNDHWSAGKQSGQAYCSVTGVLCHGPIDYIQFIFAGGKLVSQPDLARPDNPLDPNYWCTTIEFGGVDADLGVSNRVRVYWGREDQPADSWLATMTGQDHPPYRGQVLVVFERLHCGQIQANSQARPALPNIEFAVVRLPSPSLPPGLRLPASLGAARWRGVNLVSAFWDILTHSRAGVGLSAATLDAADWEAKAAALEAGTKPAGGLAGVDAYVSPLLTGSAEAEKVLQDGLQYIDGWFQTIGGKVRLDWYPNDGSSIGSVPEISEHDLVEPPQVSTQSLAEAPTTIVVECLEGDDPPHELAEAAETANVPFVREITGETAVLKLQRPWFTSRTSASRYANRAAALATIPAMEGEWLVRLNRATRLDGSPLRVGDRFLATYGPLAMSIPARLVERMETETTARLRWRRERGLSAQPYVPAVDPRVIFTLGDPPAPDSADWRAIEAPSGLSSTAALLIIARRPSDTLSGLRVYLDEDGDWSVGATLFGAQGFAARVTLAADVADDANICSLSGTDPDVSPALGSGATSAEQVDDTLLLLIDDEWCSIKAVTSTGPGTYSVGIARGRLGSYAVPHFSGAAAWVIRKDRLVLWRSATFAQNATRFFKVAFYHALKDGPLSLAKAVTFADRTPPPVDSLTALALPGAIKLTWNNPGVDDLAAVLIYEAATSARPDLPAWRIASPANAYTRDGLAAGATRFFWVQLLDAAGNPSPIAGPVSAQAGAITGGAAGYTLSQTMPAAVVLADAFGVPVAGEVDGAVRLQTLFSVLKGSAALAATTATPGSGEFRVAANGTAVNCTATFFVGGIELDSVTVPEQAGYVPFKVELEGTEIVITGKWHWVKSRDPENLGNAYISWTDMELPQVRCDVDGVPLTGELGIPGVGGPILDEAGSPILDESGGTILAEDGAGGRVRAKVSAFRGNTALAHTTSTPVTGQFRLSKIADNACSSVVIGDTIWLGAVSADYGSVEYLVEFESDLTAYGRTWHWVKTRSA